MIDILLATYNGEKYLPYLLSSIENQTCKEWNLIVSDDGSTDKTLYILHDFEEKYENKVKIYYNKSGSAKKNFLSMLKYAKSDYIMFCDQDDIWIKNKISNMLECIKNKERQEGKNMPILIASDLKVVDERLNIINESFYKYVRFNYDFSVNALMCQNKIPGCSMLFNKELLKILSRDINSDYITMHDSWVALLATIYGKIFFIDEPLVLYRQHDSNSVGVENVNKLSYKIKRLRDGKEIKKENMDRIIEVRYLYELYGNSMNKKKEKLVKKYSELYQENRMGYRISCIKNKFLKHTLKRTIIQLVFCHK